MSNKEDVLLDYIQEVPASKSSNLDGTVAGVQIYRIEAQPAQYIVRENDRGVIIEASINFNVFVSINPRSL